MSTPPSRIEEVVEDETRIAASPETVFKGPDMSSTSSVLDSTRGADPDGVPVLWHLKVSNFNEKARWALDYKRIPHRRRAAVPGKHTAVARRLTGGTTFPILVLGDRAIGDSARIIEALEQQHPEPPLYPADPAERRRALELEEYFDEELGPYARLLFLHHALPDSRLMLGAFFPDLGGARLGMTRLVFPLLRGRVAAQFQISEQSVAEAYEKLAAAGRRFRSELQPSGYLVGETFSVADLTLAALLAPLVAPMEFPYPQPQHGHVLLAPLVDAVRSEGLAEFTHAMYTCHRGTSAELVA